MKIMEAMPEFDMPGQVRKQLVHRGVVPPTIVYAAHGPDAFMLGAAALLVDEFLRTPPSRRRHRRDYRGISDEVVVCQH